MWKNAQSWVADVACFTLGPPARGGKFNSEGPQRERSPHIMMCMIPVGNSWHIALHTIRALHRVSRLHITFFSWGGFNFRLEVMHRVDHFREYRRPRGRISSRREFGASQIIATRRHLEPSLCIRDMRIYPCSFPTSLALPAIGTSRTNNVRSGATAHHVTVRAGKILQQTVMTTRQ